MLLILGIKKMLSLLQCIALCNLGALLAATEALTCHNGQDQMWNTCGDLSGRSVDMKPVHKKRQTYEHGIACLQLVTCKL